MDRVVVVSFYLLNVASIGRAAWHIAAHSPDQDLTEGDELELMCRSSKGVLDVTGNSNWKTCLWKRERDSRFCLMEYNCVQHCNSVFEREVWEVTTNCDTGLKDVTYFGSDPNKENHICGIWVPSSIQCLLIPNSYFD